MAYMQTMINRSGKTVDVRLWVDNPNGGGMYYHNLISPNERYIGNYNPTSTGHNGWYMDSGTWKEFGGHTSVAGEDMVVPGFDKSWATQAFGTHYFPSSADAGDMGYELHVDRDTLIVNGSGGHWGTVHAGDKVYCDYYATSGADYGTHEDWMKIVGVYTNGQYYKIDGHYVVTGLKVSTTDTPVYGAWN